MEALLRADLSAVRIHEGHEAVALGALAFTHGSDVYFAPGQFNPATPAGQRLIAHELTHVVQQRSGRVRNPLGSGIAVVQDPALEAEAERMALRAGFSPPEAPAARSAGTLQAMAARQPPAPPPLRPLRVAQPRMLPAGRPFRGVIQCQRRFLKAPKQPDNVPDDPIAKLKFKASIIKIFIHKDLRQQLREINPEIEVELAWEAQTLLKQLDEYVRMIEELVSHETDLENLKNSFGYVAETASAIAKKLNKSFLAAQEEYAAIYALSTLKEIETWEGTIPVITGVPPSTVIKIGPGKKYKDISDYIRAKQSRQQAGTHIEVDSIKSWLKRASGSPSNASVVILLPDSGPIHYDQGNCIHTYDNLFSIPFLIHNHEIDESKNDGEVGVLSSAYAACMNDFQGHEGGTRIHRIALIGPFGACDGCKVRIKKFKSEWLLLAHRAKCSAELVITYFYRHEADLYRNKSTQYGYFEAQKGRMEKLKSLGNGAPEKEYWYRSTWGQYPKPKKK